MKLFVLLAFCLTFLSSETQTLINENCKNCKVTLPKKHVENELKAILHKVKSYKKEKNQQIITLKEQLSSLTKTFKHYKATKKYEILQLKKRQKNSPTMASLKNKNQKIKELQHQLALLKEQLSQKNKVIISLKKQITPKNQPLISTIIQEENTPKQWIKITVNNDLNIYDLALRYYGDSLEYEKIYMANQDKIDKNYQIRNGMSLKIPITENFIEQPIFVNTAN